MKKINLASAAAVALGLFVAEPALADDDPDAALKAVTEHYKNQTANVNAQKGLIDAQTAALGIPTIKGGTTVAATAGKMEAAIMSASAMNAAAKAIRIQSPTGWTKFIILAGNEPISFGLATTLGLEMDTLIEGGEALSCETAPAAARMFAPPVAAIGAVINALKVDTEVSGITIEPNSGALVHAVAGWFGSLAYAPSEVSSPEIFTKSNLKTKWDALRNTRHGLTECRRSLDPVADKSELAAIDASLASIDAFSTRVTQSKDGDAPLFRAAALEALAKDNPVILRVTAEAAGGTMIKRTNLWTAFGALGVKVTGGLLASYRFVDPSKGQILSEGLLVCRTDLATLKNVQKGGFNAVCDPVEPASPISPTASATPSAASRGR